MPAGFSLRDKFRQLLQGDFCTNFFLFSGNLYLHSQIFCFSLDEREKMP